MSAESIWQAFQETGDPVYYMLYKSVKAREIQEKKWREQEKRGPASPGAHLPQAED